MVVQWEPPPGHSQNDTIARYKVRYRKRNENSDETVKTVTGLQLVYDVSGDVIRSAPPPVDVAMVLTDLQQRTEYLVCVEALTVSGSGPATEWLPVQTLAGDLDGIARCQKC